MGRGVGGVGLAREVEVLTGDHLGAQHAPQAAHRRGHLRRRVGVGERVLGPHHGEVSREDGRRLAEAERSGPGRGRARGAEEDVQGGLPAPDGRVVHDVVLHERAGLEEFDGRAHGERGGDGPGRRGGAGHAEPPPHERRAQPPPAAARGGREPLRDLAAEGGVEAGGLRHPGSQQPLQDLGDGGGRPRVHDPPVRRLLLCSHHPRAPPFPPVAVPHLTWDGGGAQALSPTPSRPVSPLPRHHPDGGTRISTRLRARVDGVAHDFDGGARSGG
nr:hypothetical protein [Streptomyces sp. CLI2509]